MLVGVLIFVLRAQASRQRQAYDQIQQQPFHFASGCVLEILDVKGRVIVTYAAGTLPFPRRSTRERQLDNGFAAFFLVAIAQRKRAAVSFGNLAAQDQADARSSGLSGEERHKK